VEVLDKDDAMVKAIKTALGLDPNDERLTVARIGGGVPKVSFFEHAKAQFKTTDLACQRCPRFALCEGIVSGKYDKPETLRQFIGELLLKEHELWEKNRAVWAQYKDAVDEMLARAEHDTESVIFEELIKSCQRTQAAWDEAYMAWQDNVLDRLMLTRELGMLTAKEAAREAVGG